MSDGQSDIDYGTTDDEEPPQEDTAGDGPRRVETPSDPNPGILLKITKADRIRSDSMPELSQIF